MALLINVLTQKFELLSCMANSESGEAMDVYNIVQDKAYLILESSIPSLFLRRTKLDQPYYMLYSFQQLPVSLAQYFYNVKNESNFTSKSLSRNLNNGEVFPED